MGSQKQKPRPLLKADAAHGGEEISKGSLLRLLLFLLADADFELLRLGFLVAFPVETLGRVRKIFVDVEVLRQNGHQTGRHRAVRARDAIALYIGNRHNDLRIAWAGVRILGAG